jgi:hypothetical protein
MRNAADPRLSTPIQRLPEFSKARRWRGQRATLPRRLRGQPRVTRVTLKLAYEVSAELQFAGRVMSPNLIYPYVLRTRKSAGLMTRKLSVTESQKTAQFFGTSTRRKCRTDRQKSL